MTHAEPYYESPTGLDADPMLTYESFLESKMVSHAAVGFDVDESKLNPALFPFQKACVRWALRKGKSCLFQDCGMGKTPQQLDWAACVCDHTDGNVLIVAPLAVSAQTIQEGEKFRIIVNRCGDQSDMKQGINITNYERLDRFDATQFFGVVLDESSILKSYSGKTRNQIIDMFSRTPYKLACSATPAPNDFIELGNHSEFVGAMSRTEMLAMFFIHDSNDTQKWRLKGHADGEFWKWMASWAVMLRMPSDLGFSDNGFILPKLQLHEHIIKTGKPLPGRLFVENARTLMDRRAARRLSIEERAAAAAELANSDKGQWLIWCDLNDESAKLSKMINGAVEVKGADSQAHKENAMLGFSAGNIRVLVTKPSIAGFGMNWQNCHNMAFVGLSDSYEKFYQATRRCWRFGQEEAVNAHIITAETEGATLANIKRKDADARQMVESMVKNTQDITRQNVLGAVHSISEYKRESSSGEGWELHLGDCVDVYRDIESESVGYTIFSPPFSSLYTYSNSERDMGNSKNDNEFMIHFRFLVADLFRVTMPGRSVSFHCTNIPAMKERDGYIGLKDFRGDLIRVFLDAGFIFHSEHLIWKDPLIEATRTKALGLMHKQIEKDSSRCRAGIPDYLVTMRKPGENPVPIPHPEGFLDFIGIEADEPNEHGIKYSHHVWRKYASPVWMDIRQTRTLNYRVARDNKDERHICPLQLDVIERGIALWSKRGDLVSSPFAGIGSEGFVALQNGRRFIGSELKRSYFDVASKNLRGVKETGSQRMLFT